MTTVCVLRRDDQGMELCSYADYCPDGGGMPPRGGVKRGDEWAPMADEPNRWVQVGVWGGSGANTCLAHDEVANGMKHPVTRPCVYLVEDCLPEFPYCYAWQLALRQYWRRLFCHLQERMVTQAGGSIQVLTVSWVSRCPPAVAVAASHTDAPPLPPLPPQYCKLRLKRLVCAQVGCCAVQ